MGGVASRLQGGEAVRRADDSGEEVKYLFESFELYLNNTKAIFMSNLGLFS